MKQIWIFLLLAAAMFPRAEAEIRRYTDTASLKKSGVTWYAATGHTFQPEVSTEVKTPDGENSLALKIVQSPADGKSFGKQVNFLHKGVVGKGWKYRISFFYKGSVPGSISYVAARQYPPYSAIGKRTGRTLKVTTGWQKEVREFTVEDEAGAPLAFPRFMVGLYPGGGTIYLGPVMVERLDRSYESLLSNRWRWLADPGNKLPVDRIPEGVAPAELRGNSFDIAQAEGGFQPKACAVFYQEFTAPADGEMTLGMAADWCFACYINGELAYNTLKQGNLSQDYAPENHVFNVPVRKGRNLIAVKVFAGSKGWRFVCGKVPAVSGNPALARLFKPAAGKEFRPVDPARFLEVKPGTALDFSQLTERHLPAGKFGRLVVREDGRPAFEQRKEKPVRFFSFNWCISGMWRPEYHKWDKTKMDRFADAVLRRGYNLVRIHIPERFFVGWDILAKYRKNTEKDVSIPQTVAELEEVLDKGNLDRFDYLVAAFRKRGIYVTFDLAGRAMITRVGTASHENGFKAHLFHSQVYRNHWKLFTDYLMKHVNPYTGTAYRDEPAIVLVNFINEQDLRFASGLAFLTGPFRESLRAKYRTDAALSAAWGVPITFDTVPEITESDLRGGGRRAQDTGEFLIATMREMTTWFYRTIRSTGYPGLVNHWDMIMRTLELPGRAFLPVVAQHTYFSHPNSVPPLGVIPKSVRPNSFVGNHASDCVTGQGSSLKSSYFRAAAAARFLDRPFFITEYSHSAPNRFRHERGLYFSSYAALQDWSALVSHADTVRLHLDPFLKFDSAYDPISRVNEALTALIYLRGDVKSAPHSVALEMKSEKLFPDHYLAAVGDDYAKLAFVTRLGILYPEIKPLEPVGKADPTVTIVPESFSPLSVSQWYVQAATSQNGKEKELFPLLRHRGILSAANPTDPGKGIYASETGELILNTAAETMTVVTPRLEGAIVKKDQPVKLGALFIRRCTLPASVALAALDGARPLKEAKRLLLMFSTNAFNTGQIFDTKEQRICFESGNYPALIEAGKLEFAFDNADRGTPEVWALHFDGTRSEKLPATVREGKLLLQLDTSKLKNGAAFFEIVYR